MPENITHLLDELERFSSAAETGNPSAALNIGNLSGAERKAAVLIEQILCDNKRARETLMNRENTLGTLNRAALILLAGEEKSFEEAMSEGLDIIAGIADIDRMSVFSNSEKPEGLCLSQIYRWRKDSDGVVDTWEELKDVPYSKIAPQFEHILASGECIGGPVSRMPGNEVFKWFGCVTVLIIPVFDNGKFWGATFFERLREENFSNQETDVLRSASFMLANAVIRNEKAEMVRQANEQSRLMLEAIQEQAHWYKSILDGIPLPIFVTDTDMNIVFTNSASADAFGKDRDAILGCPCNIWNTPICGTDDCSIVRVKSGLKQTFFKQDGISFQVDTEGIRNAAGELTGYMEIIQDITDAENAARREADLASEAKSAFLATMSHEMRTPLNAVIGMTEIGRRASGIERKNYALDRIGEASTHLLGVINDILDISKIEADKLELSNVEFNFERMLQKVITVISYRANEKRQGFSVNVDGKTPDFLIGDDQRLAQVITNLLSNAVKFTPEGGLISLDVSLLGEENGIIELKIEVADNGIGITAEQQKGLFNKFSQAESGTSREFGGSGLGLAISKRLVEMMGGRIWIESKQGKGSRFIFTIKVPYSAKNLRSLLDPGVQWDKVRVLAADGSGLARQFFKDTFNRMGVECEVAASSAAVCQIIESGDSFNIYFIDRHLPDIDGTGLTRWIKSHTGHGLAVLTSASDWETLHEAVKESGADKGFLKPFLSSALADCLNECMAGFTVNDEREGTGEFAGKTLLLAEDVDINREIVMSLLEDTGLKIICAENGKDALVIMEKESEMYDIVFMDIQMPVMDGLEAVRRIRGLPSAWCAEIPIVAMTANVFKDSVDECLAVGMNGHIGKPVSSESMIAVLRKYLVGAESRHEPEFLRRNSEPLVKLTEGIKVSVDVRTFDERGEMNVLSLPSTVEEVVNDGYFIIQMPLYQGAYYPLPFDEMFLMYFTVKHQNTEEPEMFSVPVYFAEKINRESSEYAGMKPLGKIERSQRRECYRLSISASVSLKRTTGSDFQEAEARTIDFSDGGMLLVTDENIGVNERVILDFNIGRHETVEAVTLRSDVSDRRQPRYSVAVKFENTEKEQKERFYNFIKERQMDMYFCPRNAENHIQGGTT